MSLVPIRQSWLASYIHHHDLGDRCQQHQHPLCSFTRWELVGLDSPWHRYYSMRPGAYRKFAWNNNKKNKKNKSAGPTVGHFLKVGLQLAKARQGHASIVASGIKTSTGRHLVAF